MKEAAGEANMTVITIVLIAIVLGVGTVLVTNMMNKTAKSGCCEANGGTWKDNTCYKTCTTAANGVLSCSGTVDTKCTDSNR